MLKLNQAGFLHTAGIVAIIVAVIAGGLIAVRAFDIYYFNHLKTNLTKAAGTVAEGNPWKVDVDTVNVCYNTEQGPWDNGRLWCFVNQAYYAEIKDPSEAMPAAQELIDRVEKELKGAGFRSGSIGTPQQYDSGVIMLKRTERGDMRSLKGVCNFTLRYPTNKYTSNYLPNKRISDKKVQLTVACGGHSSLKLFPDPPK